MIEVFKEYTFSFSPSICVQIKDQCLLYQGLKLVFYSLHKHFVTDNAIQKLYIHIAGTCERPFFVWMRFYLFVHYD